MKKILVSTLFILLPLLAANASAIGSADDQLIKLMDQMWSQQLKASPITASLLGESADKNRLDDFNEASVAAKAKRLDKVIAALNKIDFNALNRTNKTHYQVFEWMLTHERKTLDFDWHYITFTALRGWQTKIVRVATLTAFNSEADYRDYIARLAQVGRYADEHMAMIKTGIDKGYVQPCAALNGYEGSISGFISPTIENSVFYAPFARIPDSYGAKVKQELQAQGKAVISNVVNPAYSKYLDFFKTTYRSSCRTQIGLSSIPKGGELYQHFIRYYTTVDMDPNAVHELGLSEVKRIRGEMQQLIEQVKFKGSFKEFLAMLHTDPRFYTKDAELYMAKAALIAKRTDGKLPEFFSFLPRNPYGLSAIPDATAPGVTTAYYERGSSDGKRAGQYFLNLYKLDSRPLYELTALTLHEGVPGHHLQIAIQQELENMPEFRRYYYFHAYGEGWALYSEKLGEEMGMYNTPYDSFGRLIYEMWRASRLVVDSGIHAKGWTRQQAIDFMVENTALTLHNITTEVDRYITYPGQALAYKVGELKLWELRDKAERALGQQFSLRDFHTLILTTGAVPLTVLENEVEYWVKQRKSMM